MIAAYVTGLASLSEKSAETDALDFVKRVQQSAIESYEGEYSLEDLEDMFSSFDLDELADELDRDVEIDDETGEALRSQFSDESLEAGRPMSIQDALSMPIDKVQEAFENDVGLRTVVDSSLEVFVGMNVDLARDTHERMQERRERV